MAKELPKIVWNLPPEGLPDAALAAIQDYTYNRFMKLISSLPEEQRSAAYDIVVEDLKNGGKEFGKYLL